MRLLRNIFSDWAYLATSFLIILFLTPYVIATLGNERYGLWALILSIVALFALADLGSTSAMRRYYAQAIGRNDDIARIQVFSNVLVIFLFIALAIISLTLIMSLFAPALFNLAPEQIPDFRIAILILGLSTAILFAFKPFGGVLAAYERYDIVNMVEIVGAISQGAGIFLVLYAGHGLLAMSAVLLGVTTAKGLMEAYLAKKLYTKITFNRKHVGISQARPLFNYSMISFVIILCDYCRDQLDILIIGSALSVSNVTYYAIAAQFILYFILIARSITKTYIPRISRMEGMNDRQAILVTTLNGTRLVATLVLFIAISMVTFAKDFLSLWLGDGFDTSYYILLLLTPAITLTLSQSILISVFFATGHHGYYARLYIIEILVKSSAAIFLIPYLGIYSPAVGSFIAAFAIKTYFLPARASMIIGVSLSQLYRDGYARPFLFALTYGMLCLPAWFFLSGKIKSLGQFSALAFLYFVIGTMLAVLIVLTRDEKRAISKLPVINIFGNSRNT